MARSPSTGRTRCPATRSTSTRLAPSAARSSAPNNKGHGVATPTPDSPARQLMHEDRPAPREQSRLRDLVDHLPVRQVHRRAEPGIGSDVVWRPDDRGRASRGAWRGSPTRARPLTSAAPGALVRPADPACSSLSGRTGGETGSLVLSQRRFVLHPPSWLVSHSRGSASRAPPRRLVRARQGDGGPRFRYSGTDLAHPRRSCAGASALPPHLCGVCEFFSRRSGRGVVRLPPQKRRPPPLRRPILDPWQ